MTAPGSHHRRRIIRVAVLASAALAATASIATSLQSNGVPATSAGLNEPTAAIPIPASRGGGFLIADMGNNVVRKVDSAGNITTVAGTGVAGHTGDGGLATQAEINAPTDAVPTPDGGFLIAEGGPFSPSSDPKTVRKVSASGIITTVAGGTPNPSCVGRTDTEGDGCPATQASLGEPTAAVPTSDGGFLIADLGNATIRKVDQPGMISRVAGASVSNPMQCAQKTDMIADGCPALGVALADPTAAIPYNIAGAAVNTTGPGFLITEEQGCRVRYVNAAGVISTVAGSTDPNNPCRTNGDPLPASGVSATSVKLSTPTDARPTADGGFLIADGFSCQIRKVLAGIITTVASTGCQHGAGFGTTAAIPTPGAGFLVADSSGMNVDSVSSTGTLTNVAGDGMAGFNVQPPVITGSPVPGGTLMCSQGVWSNSPTSFAYQWNRDGTPIASPATPTYGVTAADVGHALTCSVTATAGTTSSKSTSAATNVVGPSHTLTVVLSGHGTVTGSGISCPGSCSNSYPLGTVVALTPSAASGSSFAGWQGGCSGTGACSVTMSADRSVTATFTGAGAAVLSHLRISPSVFSAAASGPTATAARLAQHKPKKTGAKVTYVLSAVAPVRLTVRQALVGRIQGKGKKAHCAARGKPSRKSRRCTLTKTLGRFTHLSQAGSNAFHFTGRVSGRSLRRGAYSLTAVAISTGGSRKVAIARFKIAR